MTYAGLKQWVSMAASMDQNLLHVHIGLFIFFLFTVLLRRRFTAALMITLFAAVLNELLDWFLGNPTASVYRIDLGAIDIVNTCLWPTIITLLANSRLLSFTYSKPPNRDNHELLDRP